MCFSRKLTGAQTKYSITDLELMSIVETLREFKGMLWGQKIKVCTDHQNLTRDALGLTSDRVYHWRLLLEEYGPDIVYIKGIHNTVADAISCLDFDPMVNPDHHSYIMYNMSAEMVVNIDHFKWQAMSYCLVNYDTTCQSSGEQDTCLNNALNDVSCKQW